MNIANKLTLFRVFMIPVFIVCFIFLPETSVVPALIFIIASITDFLDGHLARSRNLVTTFGKFVDPLADKMLSCSSLIMLIEIGFVPAWSVVIIVARELTISGFRILAASNGVTLAASIWGKAKTMTQFIAIILLLFARSALNIPLILGQGLYYVSVILTIMSLVDYIYKNIQVLDLDNI
ncbi:MAG: CDP-diacylglycerol--glycerol-3-phosphate 3-phosphatidyltransferase [Finegoldia sp.]|nr:CDP-diacylglycerol--glycerol-3-phosphate 3-phosphatidyltransferase [Finegoldia sp.]